jgi:superfamily II RNA helicase
MILSLLRVRDFKVEDMMRSSFSEFASQQQFPEIRRQDEQAESKLQELNSKQWPEGYVPETSSGQWHRSRNFPHQTLHHLYIRSDSFIR